MSAGVRCKNLSFKITAYQCYADTIEASYFPNAMLFTLAADCYASRYDIATLIPYL